MRHIFDGHQYLVLGCAALVFFTIIQSLIAFAFRAYTLRTGGKRAVERLRNLPRGEQAEPIRAVGIAKPIGVQPSVSMEVLLPVGREGELILERAEPLETQPAETAEARLPADMEAQPILRREKSSEAQVAVRLELPLPVDALVQPSLERVELPDVQAATNPRLLPQVCVEVRPLKHEKPPEPQLDSSPKLPLQVGSKVWAVCKFGAVVQGAPGIITGVADMRFFWQSPTYLCTFANNIRTRARPKDIESHNHGHSLEELEQPDLNLILSRRMSLRAQKFLYRQRPIHLS